MSVLSEIIRNSPKVRDLIEKERQKHEAAIERDAEAWQSYVHAAHRLAIRMALSRHLG